MKTQENAVQETVRQQPLMKRIFRGCKRFLGTFLFINLMSYNLLVSLGVDTYAHRLLPYFVIPSCFVCVTIGASYWLGSNVIQWRSYRISSMITIALNFLLLWTLTSTNYYPFLLQSLTILSLPIVSTVYSIWKLRKVKRVKREAALSNAKHQSFRRSIALSNTVRLIALISFCSVFLENAQHILSYIFVPEARLGRMYSFSEVLDVIIAVYAVWLLICFARKEFVQLGGQSEKEPGCIKNTSNNN